VASAVVLSFFPSNFPPANVYDEPSPKVFETPATGVPERLHFSVDRWRCSRLSSVLSQLERRFADDECVDGCVLCVSMERQAEPVGEQRLPHLGDLRDLRSRRHLGIEVELRRRDPVGAADLVRLDAVRGGDDVAQWGAMTRTCAASSRRPSVMPCS
jgi:hypothetical protein